MRAIRERVKCTIECGREIFIAWRINDNLTPAGSALNNVSFHKSIVTGTGVETSQEYYASP
jgi:hypothetical protein